MAFQPAPGYTGTETCTIDKKMVTTVGIAKFYKACQSQSYSNLKLYNLEQDISRQQCNAGCHYYGYRISTLRAPEATQEDAKKAAKKLGKPVEDLTSNIIGALNTKDDIADGIGRTIETWAKYKQISDENGAALNFMINAFDQAYQLKLSVHNNPFTKMVIRVVTEYFLYLPEEILFELAAAGKVKMENMDVHAIIKAVQMNLTAWDVGEVDTVELKAVASALGSQPSLLRMMRERMKNKITGKIHDKIAEHIATSIGVTIAKKIAVQLEKSFIYQELMKVPKLPRGTKNLLTILKEVLVFQGHLEQAAQASRELQSKSPEVWRDLRANHGLDMIYYAAQPYLGEYVDRIDVARKDPVLFARVILNLLEPPTKLMSLFLPFVKTH